MEREGRKGRDASDRVENQGEEDREKTYNEDITKLVEPEGVDGCGGGHEVPLRERLVDLLGGRVELVKNPSLDHRLVSGSLREAEEGRRMRIMKQEEDFKEDGRIEGERRLTAEVGVGTKSPSSLSMANRVAFQSLLQNFLYPSTRRISRLISRPAMGKKEEKEAEIGQEAKTRRRKRENASRIDSTRTREKSELTSR